MFSNSYVRFNVKEKSSNFVVNKQIASSLVS